MPSPVCSKKSCARFFERPVAGLGQRLVKWTAVDRSGWIARWFHRLRSSGVSAIGQGSLILLDSPMPLPFLGRKTVLREEAVFDVAKQRILISLQRGIAGFSNRRKTLLLYGESVFQRKTKPTHAQTAASKKGTDPDCGCG